jgi:hypothetical protein
VAVPLGTSLVGIETGGEEKAWLRVRTADGKEGWVLARLTRRFDNGKKLDVVEQIVAERNVRKGDSFATRAEVVDLVEHALTETKDAERGGRLAVLWLGAMSGAVRALPQRPEVGDPYLDWLEGRKTAVMWNEVAGGWMLSPQAFADLHTQYRDSSSADAIAWAEVENGLAGECEGYLPCYIESANKREGEYLRRHSNGRRVGDALSRLDGAATLWAASLDKLDAFNAERDCEAVKKSLTPLRAAVVATTVVERGSTLERIDAIGGRCGVSTESAATPAVSSTPAAPTPTPVPSTPAPRDSRGVSATLLGITFVVLVAVAGMVMLRRRAATSPTNRSLLS